MLTTAPTRYFYIMSLRESISSCPWEKTSLEVMDNNVLISIKYLCIMGVLKMREIINIVTDSQPQGPLVRKARGQKWNSDRAASYRCTAEGRCAYQD